MALKRKRFYDTFRVKFHPTLTQSQVDGYNAILDYWETASLDDLRWLAYVLASVYHETGQTILPVRDGFAKTDEGAIKAVTRLYDQGKLRYNYAKPDANGNSYFGRGLVPLTQADNYKRMGEALGMGTQLYDTPSLVLDLDISVKVLFQGMIDGLLTGHRLADYFTVTKTDWQQARKIVNGMNRADRIADYARRFQACLN